MANLEFANPELPQVITCGSTFDLAFQAQQVGGTAFSWTGYTPKARLTVGSVSITVSGSVVGAAVTASWTSAQTGTLPDNAWGSITVWADADASTTNIAIGTVMVRTTFGAIP